MNLYEHAGRVFYGLLEVVTTSRTFNVFMVSKLIL